MKYPYEDLSEGQFEQLVVRQYQGSFGMAIQGFARVGTQQTRDTGSTLS
jgi:hypothetical protein